MIEKDFLKRTNDSICCFPPPKKNVVFGIFFSNERKRNICINLGMVVLFLQDFFEEESFLNDCTGVTYIKSGMR